jgi:hypothetical protein
MKTAVSCPHTRQARTPGGGRNRAGSLVVWHDDGYHQQAEKRMRSSDFNCTGKSALFAPARGRFDEDGFDADGPPQGHISGGFNISPSDLEAELRRHPDGPTPR